MVFIDVIFFCWIDLEVVFVWFVCDILFFRVGLMGIIMSWVVKEVYDEEGLVMVMLFGK